MELFLGEYINLDSLGKGSFAEVFQVRHHELGYVRALRVLDGLIVTKAGEKLIENERYKKFRHECELLLQLGNGCHPNIVRIYKPDLRQNKAFVEMDYVKGNNIHEFLEQNQNFVKYEEVIRLATQISSALAYCHEDIYRFRMDPAKDKLPEGCLVGSIVNDAEKRKELIDKYKIIHNDIHSGNIMRREDGNYILLDFGLSIEGKEFAPSSIRSHGGALITRAPELWDEGIIPTEQSDIYSFGVVMYQCLAGRVPFPCDIKELKNNSKAQAEMGKAHKEAPVPLIEDIRKEFYEKKYSGQTYKRDYPQWLEVIIRKCLSKDPAERFKNGTELYETILRQEDNLPENFIKKLNEEKEDLVSKNDTLNSANQSLKLKLTQSDSSLKSAKERIGMLEKRRRRNRLLCIILSVLFGLCAALCAYLYTDHSVSNDDGKLAEHKGTIDQKNDTIAKLRELLQSGNDAVLAQKDARISELEGTIQELNSNMPDVASLEKQLREKTTAMYNLTVQLNDLNTSFDKKKSEVTTLQEQLKRKDAKIRELTAIISQKDTIIKNKNNEIRVLRED